MKIKLNQFRFRNSTNSPFLSGDSFAALTDYYIYGKFDNQKIDLKRLHNAKSLFLNSHMIRIFLHDIQNIELNNVVLVTGNSDLNFVSPIIMPKGIELWLCQNNAMPFHPKIRTLPIGIENLRYGRLGLKKWYKSISSNSISNKILVPPMSPTNPKRITAIQYAQGKKDVFDTYTEYLHENDYFSLVEKYKFILCCEGNGFDNHRVWETLYRGSFPVLIRSPWSESLEYLNLPILLVESLEKINIDMLSGFLAKYAAFNPKDYPQLWTPFWKKIIDSRAF